VLESVRLPVLLVDVLLGLDDLTGTTCSPSRRAPVLNLTGQPPRAWVLEHITRFAPAACDNIRALLLTDHAAITMLPETKQLTTL
jgi:hypothetical protein